MNYDSEEYRELKLSEPVIWNITRKFPEDAQKKIDLDHEMSSMKDFNAYSEFQLSKHATAA